MRVKTFATLFMVMNRIDIVFTLANWIETEGNTMGIYLNMLLAFNLLT